MWCGVVWCGVVCGGCQYTAEYLVISAGVADLHALGFAHTDIKIANVFVDKGVAFLDDLEYVVKTDALARRSGRGFNYFGPQTAAEQDLQQLQLFAADVTRL